MIDIEGMSPQQFQEYMNELKISHSDIYSYVMNRYFSDVINEKNPIIASWNNDFDNVWDAQAYLNTHMNNRLRSLNIN